MIAAALGWTGTVGTFVAYVLVSRGSLDPKSRRYAVLNMLGGVTGAIGSASYGAWPSAVSNVIWAVVGLYSLLAQTGITVWLPRNRFPGSYARLTSASRRRVAAG